MTIGFSMHPFFSIIIIQAAMSVITNLDFHPNVSTGSVAVLPKSQTMC